MLTPSYHTKLIEQLIRVQLFGQRINRASADFAFCAQCRRWKRSGKWATLTSESVCWLQGRAHLVCLTCYYMHIHRVNNYVFTYPVIGYRPRHGR